MLPDGPRVVRFDEGVDVGALLEAHGELPLPPYVGPGDAARAARYQTVFARVPGSVAAPTASLHFTPEILAALRARGVVLAPLVLDVGIGTFRPMTGERIDEHVMHAERYAIPAETAAAIAAAKRERRAGGRGRDDRAARARGRRARGRRQRARGRGRDRAVRHAGLPLRRGRRAADQLPPAALDPAGAGGRVRGLRAHPGRLPGGDRGPLPVLLVRRRDVRRDAYDGGTGPSPDGR